MLIAPYLKDPRYRGNNFYMKGKYRSQDWLFRWSWRGVKWGDRWRRCRR